MPEHLVQRMRVRHGRCSYAQLLWHYCPTPFRKAGMPEPEKGPVSSNRTGVVATYDKHDSLTEVATPMAQASHSKMIVYRSVMF